jgi:hypothetical protein
VRRRTIAVLAAVLLAVALSVVPAFAGAATVTTICTEIGTVTLPPGSPPKQGLITVEVNGRVVTTHWVPGPCAAPGFLKRG